MRSPITRCSVGCNFGTPVMVSVEVPPPICAPIWLSICTGRRHRLASGVVDRRHTLGDHRRHQDVLRRPDRGNSSWISAPGDAREATTQPCSIVHSAPSCRRPDWCMSSGLDPIASPPGRRDSCVYTGRRAGLGRTPTPELADGGKVRLVLRLIGRGDPDHRSVQFDVGAQSPKNPRPSAARPGCRGSW